MVIINYSIIAPKTVEQTATEFKKNLKKKIKPKPFIKLKNVKKEKPEKAEKASDLYLVFSPVVSRTGTDISAALKNIENNKPTILVVLHHTFDTEAVVSKSGTLVERENVHTVDCLFYEDKGLLDCKKNEEAYEEAANWIVSNKNKFWQPKGIFSKQSPKEADGKSSHKQGTSSTDVQSSTDEHK